MTMIARYPTKKALKESVGKQLRFTETSLFGAEYTPDGKFCVCNERRTWFAVVTMQDGKIAKVT